LVALRVVLKVPRVVGDPEIKPVVVLMDKPGGKLVAPKLVGPSVAVMA
jgi:hypothetical protein